MADFEEFPTDPRLASFDASDRKFVAVAIKAGSKPPVLNAVDSDWWNHLSVLREHGVKVEFLCPDQFQDEPAVTKEPVVLPPRRPRRRSTR